MERGRGSHSQRTLHDCLQESCKGATCYGVKQKLNHCPYWFGLHSRVSACFYRFAQPEQTCSSAQRSTYQPSYLLLCVGNMLACIES
eukprot:6176328-Pleurochrysis_carterae.AAC.1